MCLYPVSQTPCVTCCSYTGSIACTSSRTGSELKVEAVDQLWYMCNATPCSSAPLHQATQQECVRDRASPTWLSPIQRFSRETRSSCTLPPQRVVWTYRPLPFCADAPSPPVLLPSAAPSLFCRTKKNNSATPSDKHYLTSPPPTQLRA